MDYSCMIARLCYTSQGVCCMQGYGFELDLALAIPIINAIMNLWHPLSHQVLPHIDSHAR